jgi:organic radical activating enzyme
MDEIKNFCYIPFRELYIDHNSGDTTPGYKSCCIQTDSYKGTPLSGSKDWFHTDEGLVSIRKQFLSDKQPSRCISCWKLEASGSVSKRQASNKRYKERRIDPFDTPELEVLDVRLSNKCNLQCKICYAGNSDQIAKNMISATEAGKLDPQYAKDESALYYSNSSNIDPVKGLYEFILNNKSIKEIKFAGGEPFVMPEVEELLLKLIKVGRTNLHTFFLTNCTTVKTNVLDILKQFDSTSIGCSIDGVDEWIEYQRFPVKWESVKRNYNKLLKNDIETFITPAWCHLNLLGIIDFFKWIEEDNITCNIEWNDVDYPTYLNWELIPMKYRTNLIEQLDNFTFPTNISNGYHTLINRVKNDVREITKQERKELYTNAQLWDFNNPIKYRDMFPWAKELLNE